MIGMTHARSVAIQQALLNTVASFFHGSHIRTSQIYWSFRDEPEPWLFVTSRRRLRHEEIWDHVAKATDILRRSRQSCITPSSIHFLQNCRLRIQFTCLFISFDDLIVETQLMLHTSCFQPESRNEPWRFQQLCLWLQWKGTWYRTTATTELKHFTFFASARTEALACFSRAWLPDNKLHHGFSFTWHGSLPLQDVF